MKTALTDGIKRYETTLFNALIYLSDDLILTQTLLAVKANDFFFGQESYAVYIGELLI